VPPARPKDPDEVHIPQQGLMPWWPDAASLLHVRSAYTASLMANDGTAPVELLKIRRRFYARAIDMRRLLGMDAPAEVGS